MPLTLQEAFNPRANSIGFLRWLMAFLVIFSHAGPLGGFYDNRDLGAAISTEQSIGGVAVSGFFFFSGFLITKSRMGRSTIFRYFWRRALRIMPAFWLAMLVTSLILAPIAWVKTTGSIAGFWNPPSESPLTYFVNNMWLFMGQHNIAGMGASTPLGAIGGFDWNGSAWTLYYEFRAYILVGLMGLFGLLAHRFLASGIAVLIIVLNSLQWSGVPVGAQNAFLANPYNMMLLAPFAFGMLFALWGDKIRIDDRIAVFALAVSIFTYSEGGWNVLGQYCFLYVLMWVAIRATKLNNWERFGDLSYGIYIFAWPVMQFGAYFHLQDRGWFVYHLTVVVAVHILAFFSWHLIEKPAMSLKNWTPRPLEAAIDRGRPFVDSLKRRVVSKRFSSSNFAAKLRRESAVQSGAGTE
ncbi:acyltransferase [Agreia sp. Leaf283]|uniref:acyltransferase family protein n=1 Tax=Agreia sp. Leaf283 TaxID=1736321 RepID=UPI0006F350CD|nr:acyltransferase [Agreia sp. Leaf283]KQP56367.1 acyltransferase [Agreia sp. Leaf283]